jgi:hypothetical protein
MVPTIAIVARCFKIIGLMEVPMFQLPSSLPRTAGAAAVNLEGRGAGRIR